MKNQFNALLLTAALTGLSAELVAAHAATSTTAKGTSAKVAKAGLRYTSNAAAQALL